MNTPFTPDRLKALFQHQFNPTEWLTCLKQLFLANELRVKPEPLDTAEDQGYYWGAINTPDHYHIGLFHYVITRGSVVNRRVGLRKLVEQFTNKRWGDFDAALVVFSSRDHWRLSLICDIDGEATSPKRFTYVFGSRDLLYRTPIERFTKLQKEGITFAKMREAFSVEALSDEFFERYREQYADFVQYVTGKRYVKSGSKWEERVLGQGHAELMRAFKFDEKRVRDYIKKMMGRITFLHFLQRKGWMCGDLNYMQHLFERSPHQDDYLDAVLEPLFFGILNTRPEEREALFTAKGWNRGLLSEWKSIPYLNGGLFECEAEDLTDCQFPAEYFRKLFQFFSEYNFTIDENDPTDAEVGVDPEMLGKIFENLLEDNKDKGAFYTPKEIVRYMCRESLIAYLVTQSLERGNTNPREKVEASIRDLLNKPEEIVPRMNERQKREFGESLYRLKICDPAIGSGAFPMGLLNELVRMRALIDAWAKNDNGQLLVGDYAALKSEIICNNIYGVDIERGAIDIARLRFWLSIVVDEVTPHTLPNLDYKFMQGNSLITTFNGEYINLDSKQKHTNIVKMRMEKKRLYQLKQQYYTATGEQKHQLNVDIKDSMLSLIALQLDFEYRQWFDHHNTMHYLPGMGIPEQLSFADIKQNLPADKQRMCDMGSSLRKQLHDETKSLSERAKTDIRFFDWRMMFTEVFEGLNPGFDIVIGNPPYISAPTQIANPILAKQRNDIIACNKYESLYQKWDLYIPFIELGIHLANAKGVIAMIVPYPLTNQTYGKKLRELIITQYNLFELCDLNGTKIFDNATVSNCIPFIDKASSPTQVTNISNIDETMTIQRVFQKAVDELIPDKKTAVWNAEEGKRDANRHKDLHVLGDYCYISVGMVINADEKTAKGEFKKEDLISLTKDIIHCRKYIEAKDIDKYTIKRIRYLEYDTYRCPDLLRRPTFRELYDNVKLMFNRLGDLKVYYDEEYLLTSDSMFCAVPWRLLSHVDNKSITSSIKKYSRMSRKEMELLSRTIDLKFLLGIMNSRYADVLLTNLRGGDYHIYPEHIRNIPIPNATSEQQRYIASLVDRILAAKKENPQADTSALEAEIDQLVYQLYGLTNEEIAIIEKAKE